MGKPRKNTDHVVPGNNSLRCLNCGREQLVAFPISIPVYVAMGNAFTKEHRDCEPSEAGKARFRYANVDEWLGSWDTGISSLTIVAVFEGRNAPDRPDVPHDPSDFGRCYRLLQVAPPAWRANLSRVSERYPAWRPFVDRWSELEALYEEERPTGEAPKLYALMRDLEEIGRAAEKAGAR